MVSPEMKEYLLQKYNQLYLHAPTIRQDIFELIDTWKNAYQEEDDDPEDYSERMNDEELYDDLRAMAKQDLIRLARVEKNCASLPDGYESKPAREIVDLVMGGHEFPEFDAEEWKYIFKSATRKRSSGFEKDFVKFATEYRGPGIEAALENVVNDSSLDLQLLGWFKRDYKKVVLRNPYKVWQELVDAGDNWDYREKVLGQELAKMVYKDYLSTPSTGAKVN